MIRPLWWEVPKDVGSSQGGVGLEWKQKGLWAGDKESGAPRGDQQVEWLSLLGCAHTESSTTSCTHSPPEFTHQETQPVLPSRFSPSAHPTPWA